MKRESFEKWPSAVFDSALVFRKSKIEAVLTSLRQNNNFQTMISNTATRLFVHRLVIKEWTDFGN